MKLNSIVSVVILAILIVGSAGCSDDTASPSSKINPLLDMELVGTWVCFSALLDGEPDDYDDMYGYTDATSVFNPDGTYSQKFYGEDEEGEPVIYNHSGTWTTNQEHNQITVVEDGETGVLAYNITSDVLIIVSTYDNTEFETKWNKI